MKKLSFIFICVLVVATLCAPSLALAETKEANDVHFIAPTGIALVGDYLLISDNVADNQSAILCFDIASGTNAHKFTYLLDKQAVGMTGSNNRLFIIFADSFAEYTIESNTLTVGETYDIPNVIDVCVGKYTDESGVTQERIYLLQNSTTGDFLMYIKPDGTAGSTNMMPVAKGYDILFLNDGNYDFVYIAGEKADGENSLTRFGCHEGYNIYTDKLNANGVDYDVDYAGNHFKLKGIATNNRNYPFVYSSKPMFNLNLNQSADSKFDAQQDFGGFSTYNHDIVKVASNSSHLVILNDSNQIEIYQHITGTEPKLSTTFCTIGSDQVSTQVPTIYTGFTLAKSSGYPTNIIYKTSDDKTSIDGILTREQVDQFIILNYDGASSASYYYVFVNGRFGWIKKSDNATTPDTDKKIEIINTKVSDKVSYNAKFSSLANVYVYNLPTSDPDIRTREQVPQTASAMLSVKILQQFKEESTNILWYYVEYGQDSRGFVKSTDVANFTATAVSEMQAVEDKQINASLFNAVTLHMTKDLAPETALTYDGTTLVKLYSGDKVKVVEVDKDAGAAFVQVIANDGTTTFGWVDSSRLIDVNAMPTNAIVGLTALGIAIVLAIVFVSVFIGRKKNLDNN